MTRNKADFCLNVEQTLYQTFIRFCFLNWFLHLPVSETAGCSFPFSQRSCKSRCAIVSEVVSWLTYTIWPHSTLPLFWCNEIIYLFIYLHEFRVIKTKSAELHCYVWKKDKGGIKNNTHVADCLIGIVCTCVGRCVISEFPFTPTNRTNAINQCNQRESEINLSEWFSSQRERVGNNYKHKLLTNHQPKPHISCGQQVWIYS